MSAREMLSAWAGGLEMTTLLGLYARIRQQAGQGMAEYALILAAIAVIAMAAYSTMGSNVSTVVNNVATKL